MPSSPQLERARACANCSRAKSKCVWSSTNINDGDVCQRCSRNGLTCSKLPSVSKKKRGKATHGRVIEQKLDDIMTILLRDRELSVQSNRLTNNTTFYSEGLTPATTPALFQDHLSLPPTQPIETSLPPRSGSIIIVPGFQVTFSEADQVIQEYVKSMLPQFPFVTLPCHIAYEMYKDKPLLLRTILWVCRPPKPDVSAAFETWFRQHVAYQTVVLMKKSLELVQAILVFLAWKDIYFYTTANDTSLLQLAIGLVTDLGLNNPHRVVSPTFGSIVEDAAQLRNDLPPKPKQTGDGHRTALGVYYIASILSSLLGKRYILNEAPHVDHSCGQLMQDQEYPTDSLLVHLIRIRQIAIKVNDGFRETTDLIDDRPLQNAHSIAVASVRKELDAFMQQLPDNLKGNHLLRTHYAAIRIRLFQPLKHGDKSGRLALTTERCRTMWDGLESTQMLCDEFRLMPAASYPYLTFVSILHLALAIVKALRLLCVEDLAWDLDTVRTMYNLPDVLHQLTKIFEEASSLGSPRCKILLHGRPVFSEYAENYRGIERWYLSKLNPSTSTSNSLSTEPVVANSWDEYEGFEFWNHLSDWTSELAT